MKRLRVATIQCPKCKEIIWSRHRHDYHNCHCGAVAIDGGRDYTRVSYEGKKSPRVVMRTVTLDDKGIQKRPGGSCRVWLIRRECWPGGINNARKR